MIHWILSISMLVITYVLIQHNNYKSKFKRYGIPQPKEVPFFGCMGVKIFRKSQMNAMIKNLYNFNKEAKYIGFHFFSTPTLLIRDIDLIKNITIKNFDYFAYHKEFVDGLNDPLFGKNLAFINGDRWKEVRNLLSPAFTTSKMRGMFITISNCAKNFMEQLFDLRNHKDAIDMKDFLQGMRMM